MTERILLVDDELPVLAAYRGYLSDPNLPHRYEVTVATSGPEAIAKAEASVAAGAPFELAIIDFQITDQMDGLVTLQRLREKLPHILAIMVTGHARATTPAEALNLGFRGYLTKPVTRDVFLPKVEDVMAQVRLARQNRQLQSALMRFYTAVQRVLSLVQNAARISEPSGPTAALALTIQAALSLVAAPDARAVLAAADGRVSLHDRSGSAVPATQGALPTAGAVGMCLAAGAPVLRLAESPDQPLTGPEVGALELGRVGVLAVPLIGEAGAFGAVVLLDPPLRELTVELERSLARLGRLGGLALESASAARDSRRLLLETLRDGLAGPDHRADSSSPTRDPSTEQLSALLDQLEREITRLERGPSPTATPSQPLATADLSGGDAARVSLELATCLRDIAAFGPEGLEFCRTVLLQFRQVLRVYCQ